MGLHMETFLGTVFNLIEAGWVSLLDYLAAHVILCLLPAFFIAGALSALIPKETVTRYLGAKASKWVSYPAAAVGGFVLAVCSCTILPLFAGIWKRGAGLGPAITFLFVGPAVNILAIAYTGAAIGMDIAIARIVLSILFGIGIGLIMATIFKGEEREVDEALFADKATIKPAIWIFFLLMIGLLIAGTLQVDGLKQSYFVVHVPWNIPENIMDGLNAAHLNLQGATIIVLLLAVGLMAWKGLENVLESFSGWTLLTLGFAAATLLVAAPSITESSSISIEFTGRAIAVMALLIALVAIARSGLKQNEVASWLWETWRFVKQIFPLLIVGVFLAGVVKEIIPESWVQNVAGKNTLLANLVGVVFGVFMYFPTLVEVPIARMFLDLGMHRGPLLAYLIADPELSLQSILVTGRILGRKKTGVYVILVSIFSTLAGYLFGLVMTIL
jgi:uncharacterized membrane protein YraQ (UPF0718 family)